MDEQEQLEVLNGAQDLSERLYDALMDEMAESSKNKLFYYATLQMYIRLLSWALTPPAMSGEM